MADIKIFGKLVNATTDNIIVGTDQTYDSTQRKQQSTINAEVKDALAGKMNANPIDLVSQNLNNILTPGIYVAGGDNSVTNKPAGIDAFGLNVYKIASGYIAQELISGNLKPGAVYYRQYNSSEWSGWTPKAGVFLTNPILNQVLISDESGKLKSSGFTIASNVPADAKFTDTTYNPATTTVNGLMSTTDKAKLDGIQEGANKITVGGNITNSNGTISITKKNVTDALGFIPSGATYGQVTESEDGLMIAADKIKLNGIEEGAQKNTVTSVAGRTGAVVLTKSDVGLSNVDNTSDANKPVSTAQQAALDKKVGKVNVTGSGNAVTEASILEGTLTLTKGATYNNYTHPEKHPWDILSNPPATATRWPNSMELTHPPVSYTGNLPAALVPYIPKAGTNMFAGAKASDEITVERSTNNGTSWSDVTTEEASNIRAVFSGVIDGNILVSKASDKNSAVGHQLRITFDPKDRYCILSFIHIWGSTNGGECKLDIEYSTRDNKTKWTKIISDVVPSGWSGPTIIGMGGHLFSQPNSATSPWGLRFTFKQTKVSSEYSSIQTISSIQGFSTSIAWSTPEGNPICKSGTPYLIKDADLTTNFPGILQCKNQEVFHKGNLSWNTLPGKPSSLPASDVHPWAKAPNKPTYTKAEITGIDKVDNTPDAEKSVKYSTSSGTSTIIKVIDDRNDIVQPNSENFKKNSVTYNFKYINKMDSPAGFAGNYMGVMNFAPWSEKSGGNGYQLGFGSADATTPKLAIRTSELDATSWGSWSKIYTSADKPTKDEIVGLNEVLRGKIGKINTIGSGNAITEASISEETLTLTKGATYNNYSLPLATADVRGGVKIGFAQTGKKYPVQLEAEKMYVNVPWTDTNTTYTAGENLTLSGNSFALNQTISLTRVNASGGFYQTSDRRLKSDIKPLEHSLDDICSIPTDSFILSGKKDFGTIAQSVESKFPELVTDAELKHSDVPNPENFDTVEKNGETYVLVKEVDYAKMSILAIEGIKLLRKEIEDLKKQLSEKK